jgi:hypothetical protein
LIFGGIYLQLKKMGKFGWGKYILDKHVCAGAFVFAKGTAFDWPCANLGLDTLQMHLDAVPDAPQIFRV